MKRILFIINSLDGGGAETVVKNLSLEMGCQGYRVDIITIYDSTFTFDSHHNINVYSLNASKNKILRLLQLPLVIKRLNHLFLTLTATSHYDCITSHLNYSDLVASKSIISDVMFVIHNNYKLESNVWVKYLFNFIYKNKKLVTVSEGLKQSLIKIFDVSPNNICRIYNPIISKTIHSLSEEKMDNPFRKYFLYVGRIEEKQKKVNRLLKIYIEGKFFEKYDLVLCGTGSVIEELKILVREEHIEHCVHFLGNQKNVYKYMKASELLLLCSDYEGLPMVILEAMACGTKVVSSDCDFGPREILTGDYANYLVEDIENTDEYVKKINLALNHYPKDNDQVIAKFDVETIIETYIESYGRFFEMS